MATRKRSARPRAHGLTHLDAANRPAMVDVGAKEVTHRVAEAEARVTLPENVAEALRASGHRTKKGPVFDTAIIAGVMAAKRTHELIPFCHPLALDKCDVEIEAAGGALLIRCRVSVHHRTGVEMEALTGASVAALTVYDMCKALSHDIQIGPVRLVEKTGGKRDFKRPEAAAPAPSVDDMPGAAKTRTAPDSPGVRVRIRSEELTTKKRVARGRVSAKRGTPAKRASAKRVTARGARTA